MNETMKIVAISDTHCRHRSIRLPEGDVLIHAGDISLKGKKPEVVDFLQWFSEQPHPHKIFIAGNHDFFFEQNKDPIIHEIIPENITYLNDSGCKIGNCNIWGSPVTPWFFNWAFNKRRGEEIRRHWQMIPENTDILVVHGPPFGVLDTVINDKHVGCRDLLKTVRQIQPKLVIFGHVHESYGQVKRLGINYINACQLNESYELVNKPVVFEIPSFSELPNQSAGA